MSTSEIISATSVWLGGRVEYRNLLTLAFGSPFFGYNNFARVIELSEFDIHPLAFANEIGSERKWQGIDLP
ncbi:MAG: hypothetical protein HN667_04055 [Chloroflexi bacterium]|nr:hypothetical protein [Chloroflexota bacterium]MBT7832800.1 hypothetical protein [Chloroflexota bacterium]